MGKYEEAVADYTKAIELNPKYGLAYFNRAVARLKTGDRDGSVEDLKSSARLGNKDARETLTELKITW